jgi:hypothetical protein
MTAPILRLPVATRVFPRLVEPKPTREGPKSLQLPREIGERRLFFDMETKDEPAMRPLFGSYQLWDYDDLVPGGLGLIVCDACSSSEHQLLKEYAAKHSLECKSRDEFAEMFLAEVWEIGTTSVTFNAPFDHAKISHAWRSGTGKNRGAFVFSISRNTFKPRLRIEHLDNRKQFMQFIPSIKGQAREGWHPGYFIDVRMLAAALTDESHSLEGLCKLYKTKTQKKPAARHGIVNAEYIRYNVDDVQATVEVYEAVTQDFRALRL